MLAGVGGGRLRGGITIGGHGGVRWRAIFKLLNSGLNLFLHVLHHGLGLRRKFGALNFHGLKRLMKLRGIVELHDLRKRLLHLRAHWRRQILQLHIFGLFCCGGLRVGVNWWRCLAFALRRNLFGIVKCGERSACKNQSERNRRGNQFHMVLRTGSFTSSEGMNLRQNCMVGQFKILAKICGSSPFQLG